MTGVKIDDFHLRACSDSRDGRLISTKVLGSGDLKDMQGIAEEAGQFATAKFRI